MLSTPRAAIASLDTRGHCVEARHLSVRAELVYHIYCTAIYTSHHIIPTRMVVSEYIRLLLKLVFNTYPSAISLPFSCVVSIGRIFGRYLGATATAEYPLTATAVVHNHRSRISSRHTCNRVCRSLFLSGCCARSLGACAELRSHGYQTIAPTRSNLVRNRSIILCNKHMICTLINAFGHSAWYV